MSAREKSPSFEYSRKLHIGDMRNKHPFPILFSKFLLMASLSSAMWKPAEHTLLTPWAEAVTPANAWREYPRPQMVRGNWKNLNGLWDYSITKRSSPPPEAWSGKILVPFAIETPLSGVGTRIGDDDAIWYRKVFDHSPPVSSRIILNFEGVDYDCRLWLNGKSIGFHRGGLLPFSYDITHYLQDGENELVMRVIDDTDAPDRYQLRGKQNRNNSGIWYTPSSGIWQTVWLETVPATYIGGIKTISSMDGILQVSTEIGGSINGEERLRVSLMDQQKEVASETSQNLDLTLRYSNPKLWSPERPYLYDIRVELLNRNGDVLDVVGSYIGFRSVGRMRDSEGNWRFTLNGEEIFHLGPLDQGWWPGGFLTPPSDAAIVYEMEYLKAAGFNMIRKHKKVEPRRYYYHADRMGLLIWQDHVSGGSGRNEWPKWKKLRAERKDYIPPNPNWWSGPQDIIENDWPNWAHEQFMMELKVMIDTLFNHPSIVVWTTFNECWGQHRTMEIGKWVETYDSTRHLNIASGGNFFPVGDIADEHDYPEPTFPFDVPLYDDYIKVVGEFGGHGFRVEGHLWNPEMRNWGYGGLPETIQELRERYVKTAHILGELKIKGVAAGVYTQTTDVEGELNGLMTYDRKVFKLESDELRKIHQSAGLLESK